MGKIGLAQNAISKFAFLNSNVFIIVVSVRHVADPDPKGVFGFNSVNMQRNC